MDATAFQALDDLSHKSEASNETTVLLLLHSPMRSRAPKKKPKRHCREIMQHILLSFHDSLTLDPLERLPGLGLPGLLALHHSRVAREQPSWPQYRAKVRVVVLQGPGDPEPHRLGLPRGPATPHIDIKGKEACRRGRAGGQQPAKLRQQNQNTGCSCCCS